MVNQQYDGYNGAEKEEWVGTLADREEPVKGSRHGCCAGKCKVHGVMYRKSWNMMASRHFMPDALDRQKTREDDSLTNENWPLG